MAAFPRFNANGSEARDRDIRRRAQLYYLKHYARSQPRQAPTVWTVEAVEEALAKSASPSPSSSGDTRVSA